MITEKQLRIFDIFAKEPFAEHTRSKVKEAAREKSNNALARAINRLKQEEVVIERKVGRAGLLTLNLDKELAVYYIALSNDQKLPRLARSSLEKLEKEITMLTPFFSIVVFGSFAIRQQEKDSDLDVAVFIEDEEKKKQMEAVANSARVKAPLKMDIHVIPKAEIVEMLTNKEENLGKQIARKHLAVHNHRIFYDIIKEGMDHGFRI
ncbi:nucleotidyltransferase domain-containing protein [Candidatus Woesearchaeota archaeon]|nr:nucleotidyltransferase domain-containing protein [Candidatus Woesearchaeota archaeon]HIH38360.1 nucleotidyltransferase domain-containing protein [Candidatus Woesearchaeota archaeon]HIH48596.1 nucleotidyltransferase domain-containing protein [Candidatus Woesearchaeota archaeon]HIJ03102.1 nucleotidyltransferase domain-containing protein [Candidatus Woesearchaeota archaeon]